MDDYFNYDVAEWLYDSVSKMDDAEAEMFARFFVYEVHKQDIENNRRTLDRHVEEIHKSILRDLEIISKATPYEEEFGKPQPRDAGGRWTKIGASFKVEHHGKPKRIKGETLRQNIRNADAIDVTGALNRAGEATTTFADRWTERHDRDAYNTNERTYRRVAEGAKLLGNIPDKRVQAASAVGQFAGQFGPEAERVIGPVARRTAYRYRGTERNPDKKLFDYENRALEGALRADGLTTKDITPEYKMAAAENAATAYLAQRLPKKSLSELQRQSGKIPPSEGVIINSDGSIVTQAVGYNEDHYLPFNLKNLKGLKGGSYVRTRSSGGLTSEDIYTGLISGARSVTVVSRSGVFTLDFEDDLRGGRRYSDKARQMVGRYAQTLDAVQSEKVAQRKLNPDERAEIRDEVEEEVKGLGYKTAEVEQMISEREREYMASPRLTASELDSINRKAVELASSWTGVKTGSSVGNKERVAPDREKVPADPKKRFSYYKSELMDAAMEEKAARMYRLDAEGYKAAMDALQEQFPYYVADVEFRKVDKERPASREKDTGYVRPNYNRPKAVQAGYFDPEIQGQKGESGKFSASQLNYQNGGRTGRLVPVEEKKAEGKKEDALSDKTLNAQRAKSSAKVQRDAAIKEAADPVAGYIEQYKDTYKQLARYRDDKGDISNWTDADITKLMDDLEGFASVLKGDKNYETAGIALERSLQNARNYDDVLKDSGEIGRDQWDPRVTPAKPHKFSNEAWHNPGQPESVYKQALTAAISRAGLGDELGENFTDDQARAAELKYGRLYAAAKDVLESTPDTIDSRIPSLTSAMITAGMPNDTVRGTAARIKGENGMGHLKTLTSNFEKKWLGAKEARSIKKASATAIPDKVESQAVVPAKMSPIEGLQAATKGAGPEIQEKVKRVASAWHGDDETEIMDAIIDLPRELSAISQRLMEALNDRHKDD